MKIDIIKLNENAVTPIRATEESAGFDLYSCIDNDIVIDKNETKLIGTGISIVIPSGHFGMMCPRSGLAAKFGITLLNAPGIIDSDYRGEIKCILTNLSDKQFIVSSKMRIAQLIIMKYENNAKLIDGNECDANATSRGCGGFGSTGLF